MRATPCQPSSRVNLRTREAQKAQGRKLYIANECIWGHLLGGLFEDPPRRYT